MMEQLKVDLSQIEDRHVFKAWRQLLGLPWKGVRIKNSRYRQMILDHPITQVTVLGPGPGRPYRATL